MKTKTNLLIIFGMLILVACSSAPSIKLDTNKFDLGEIHPEDGIRSETFHIKNKGNAVLKISDVSTSCACTEGEVESNSISPGEETILTVKYDPSVHPGLEGPIKRIVYIKSNDPLNEEIELELTGNSLPSNDEEEEDEEYKGLLKDFEISPHTLNEKIESNRNFKILDVREDFEYEESHIKNTLLLSVNNITQESLNKLGLKKDEEIVLYCRSGKRSARAYEMLKELGYTNVKSLYGGIVHWSEDGYPVEEGKENEKNTKMESAVSFDKLEYDFGKITQFGGVVNTSFQVKNTGSSTLEISSISTSCGCTSAKLDNLTLEPNETTNLTVWFDPNFHEEPSGRFSRTVFLETNDPKNPEAEVVIWMDILEGQ